MDSFKEIAYKVLKRAHRPLHSNKITEIALDRGWLKTAGKTPAATMNAQLVTDIGDNGNKSKFIQTGKSTFYLRKYMKKHKHKHPNGNRGVLIKGMSKLLPSDILTDPVFKESLEKLMRGYGGIYALYKGEKLFYVGLATSLHGRVKWHLRDRLKGKWNNFRIFRIRRVRFLKDLETLILNIIMPKGNRAKGHLAKDGDLNLILRKVLREYETRIKPIRKALR